MRRTRASARLAVLATLVLAGAVPTVVVADGISKAAVTPDRVTATWKQSIVDDQIGP